MTWLKSCLAWIAGACIALAFMYWRGKKDGKQDEKEAQTEETLKKIAIAKRIDNLSNDDIDRMPSKYD